jgi:hypothetical protein
LRGFYRRLLRRRPTELPLQVPPTFLASRNLDANSSFYPPEQMLILGAVENGGAVYVFFEKLSTEKSH